MADKNALAIIGLMLGVATMFVTIVGALVVSRQEGPVDAHKPAPVLAGLPTPAVNR